MIRLKSFFIAILISNLLLLSSCSKDANEIVEETFDSTEEVAAENTPDPTIFDSNSSIITNDMWWKDNNGNDITASLGGHITKIGDTYYWVGNNQNETEEGPDIHLYSSKTLGSNSWKHEGKMVDFEPGDRGDKNCSIFQSPATGKFVIITKGIVFYESDHINGPYTKIRSVTRFQIVDHPGFNSADYKIGGGSAFQIGDDAYYVTSRRYLPDPNDNHRYTAIYKLTPDFLDIEKEISWFRNDSREATWVFKKDDTYYLSASHTAGWTASGCYYRTSPNMVDWSEEEEIGMDPPRPGGSQALKIMRSHGTQHRWIMQLGDQWIYGGDRYPYKEVESHPFEKGLYLFTPVVWEGDKPIVRYKKTWSASN